MSYIVFARKYRPKTFDEIVGQDHITTTLKNALAQGRVAHAYLFAGPRGVGKTTTARILAKALNCEDRRGADPCDACASCGDINKGTSLDILEIDGASNRGIDEIRNLKESVKFSPSRSKFKVYIIDEVHMLTPEAFNALLKTLEEPPGHVKFIFATTQAHKVPPTVLSRCQRFDFRRITSKEIIENLRRIVKQEYLSVNDDALAAIAKHADGSLRDAQVILDQITSFMQGPVGLDDVARMLGTIKDEVLFGLSEAIAKKDSIGALKIIDTLVKEGKDLLQAVVSLLEHFRNLAVVKISRQPDALLDTPPDALKRYEDHAKAFTIEGILYNVYTLSDTIDMIRSSRLARVPLEIAMVKLTRRGETLPLSEIMGRIERLEGKLPLPPAGGAEENPPPVVKTDEAGSAAETKDEASVTSIVPDDLKHIQDAWPRVVNSIKARKISVASYLQMGWPVNLEDRTLAVGFSTGSKFYKEALDSADNCLLIENAIKETLQLDLKVACVMSDSLKRPAPASADAPEETAGDDYTLDGAPAKKEVDPIIKTALDIFGGQITPQPEGHAREGMDEWPSGGIPPHGGNPKRKVPRL